MEIITIKQSQNHQCDAIENNLQCPSQAVYRIKQDKYTYYFCEVHFQEFCKRFNINPKPIIELE